MRTKIINETTREVLIINQLEAEKIGLEEIDVENGYDGKLYVKGYAPSMPIEQQNTEIKLRRAAKMSEQADPLKYDYDEAVARYGEGDERTVLAKTIWLSKKDEIRTENPYVSND